MQRKTLFAAAIGLAIVGASGAALANPTATVNGITFPVGFVPGGDQLQSGILAENLIGAVGDTLTGVGRVTSISDNMFNQTWGNGQNGVQLAYVFTGYVANTVIAPTDTTNGTITFTGGTLTFYTLPANTQINGLGSVAADVAAIESGTLWLSMTAPPEDAAGDTLVATIPAGTAVTGFDGAHGQGLLDVTGGPAAANFATRTFANPFDVGGFSDETFTSDFSTSSTSGGDFGVNGSGSIKANAVPEPLSLAVMGVGLAGIGAARRRKR